jgi:hypothetical protein
VRMPYSPTWCQSSSDNWQRNEYTRSRQPCSAAHSMCSRRRSIFISAGE